MIRTLQFEHWLRLEPSDVFLFFANPENLPRIMPPATGTKLVELRLTPPAAVNGDEGKGLAGLGSEIVASFRLIPFLPLRASWTARITEFEWNRYFADSQIKGPFKRFHHRHEIIAETRNLIAGTLVRDVIEYEVGYGFLGEWVAGMVAAQLRRTFKYRQEAVEGLLARSGLEVSSESVRRQLRSHKPKPQ